VVRELADAGLDVLYDHRDERGGVECKRRGSREVELVPLGDVAARAKQLA
jgi:hypothetical protein